LRQLFDRMVPGRHGIWCLFWLRNRKVPVEHGLNQLYLMRRRNVPANEWSAFIVELFIVRGRFVFGERRNVLFVLSNWDLSNTYRLHHVFELRTGKVLSYDRSASALFCNSCSAGTYSTVPTACCRFASGNYQSFTGSIRCVGCLAGTCLITAGSTTLFDCSNCPEGQYSSAGATACSLCPSGRFEASTGASSCVGCPAEAYSSASGEVSSTVCQHCGSGQYSAVGSTSCTRCPAGRYNSDSGSAVCTSCTAGKYSAFVGSTLSSTCLPCYAGAYSISGANSCTSCDEGAATGLYLGPRRFRCARLERPRHQQAHRALPIVFRVSRANTCRPLGHLLSGGKYQEAILKM
jgi:hypothetical protein